MRVDQAHQPVARGVRRGSISLYELWGPPWQTAVLLTENSLLIQLRPFTGSEFLFCARVSLPVRLPPVLQTTTRRPVHCVLAHRGARAKAAVQAATVAATAGSSQHPCSGAVLNSAAGLTMDYLVRQPGSHRKENGDNTELSPFSIKRTPSLTAWGLIFDLRAGFQPSGIGRLQIGRSPGVQGIQPILAAA